MPRTSSSSPNKEILEAALQGLEAQRDKLEQQISEVRSLLGHASARRGRPRKEAASASSSKEASGRKKRTLSPEARKRIAAAQKKRWASFRKAQAG